jgi:hypothetical protein
MKFPRQYPTQIQKAEFSRAVLKECSALRTKIAACRTAWDRKSVDYLRDTLDALSELHERWHAAFSALRSLVQAPYDLVTPMERRDHHNDYTKWLSNELESWRSLLPVIRRFAKAKDPKTILKAQKPLKAIHELQMALEELAKTNYIIDPEMMDYSTYHPPVDVADESTRTRSINKARSPHSA